MEFTFELQDQVGIFHLKGNLIGEKDGIPLTEAFTEALENGTNLFIINLKELQHINSTGLGVLITLLTKSRKKEGELTLAGPSAYITNLLMITKLNSIFKIYEQPEDAVEALKQQAE